MARSIWATGFEPRTDKWIGNKDLNCGPGSKPCGNACIPKDHKCRASWNKPVKALKAAAVIGGVGLVGTAILHPRSGMRQAARGLMEPVMHGGFALGNVARGNFTGAAANVSNAGLSAGNFKQNATSLAKGYGTDIRNAGNRIKAAAFKWKHHRPAKRRLAS
jgi:hypothetical protein